MTSEMDHNTLWRSTSWVLPNSEKLIENDEKFGQKIQKSNNYHHPVKGEPLKPKTQKRWRNATKVEDGGDSDHEAHIWTERERRRKMRNMFTSLHSLIPQLPDKADKSTIVEEAISYIKFLQQTVEKLQNKKLDMIKGSTMDYEFEMREVCLANQDQQPPNNSISINSFPYTTSFHTWTSPNIVLNISGVDAQINICMPKKFGFLATIFLVLEKYHLEVITVHISADSFRILCMIHAQSNGNTYQFHEAETLEDVYKLAMGEIIFCLST